MFLVIQGTTHIHYIIILRLFYRCMVTHCNLTARHSSVNVREGPLYVDNGFLELVSHYLSATLRNLQIIMADI